MQRLLECPLPNIATDLSGYQKLKIPAQNRLVAIFVDADTESEPTTENVAPDGRSNVVLTHLHLHRLGVYAQILRRIGLLSTCYVKNVPPLSETSS